MFLTKKTYTGSTDKKIKGIVLKSIALKCFPQGNYINSHNKQASGLCFQERKRMSNAILYNMANRNLFPVFQRDGIHQSNVGKTKFLLCVVLSICTESMDCATRERRGL